MVILLIVHATLLCPLVATAEQRLLMSHRSSVPSDGLELAENYITWPRPTAEQGQLQASQAKISGFKPLVVLFDPRKLPRRRS